MTKKVRKNGPCAKRQQQQQNDVINGDEGTQDGNNSS